MRFDESAKLASELSALWALVGRCDELLSALDGAAVIHVDRWAAALNEPAPRVDSVLQGYARLSLLRALVAEECECGTIIDGGRTTCSSCARSSSEATKLTVFSFVDPSRALRATPASHPSNEPVAVAAIRPRAKFGIVTALDYEFAAVKVMLDDPKAWSEPGRGAGRRYIVGKIPSLNGGVHDVAAALLVETGNNQAAGRASLLMEHFAEVEHVIMSGIAAGVPRPDEREHDVRLGDIVISDRGGVIEYDFGKDEGGTWTPRHPPRPPGAALLEATKLLAAGEHEGRRPWETYLTRRALIEGAARPADNVDAKGLPGSYPADPSRRAGVPRLFRASIASSGTLLKNPEKRDALAKQHGVKAVEMETSGIADATWSRGEGYLAVRGIVDYADLEKGDRWHKYGAVAAAAYVRALIESMPAT